MEIVTNGDLLWEPTAEDIASANLTHYQAWLAENKGLQFASYKQLWQWSVDHNAAFWESLFDYFNLTYSQRWEDPLPERAMPGARWFAGAQLNYAENIFAQATADRPMILYKEEDVRKGGRDSPP